MAQIFLAFSKSETAEKIKRMLYGSPYEVYAVCHSVSDLLRQVGIVDDSMIIMSYKLCDGTVNDVSAEISNPIMAIIKAEQYDYIENEDVFPVPLPVNRAQLLASADRFFGTIIRRARSKRNTEDEEFITKAKLLLMENNGLTEYQAHRFIQKRSMDNGMKAVDMAKLILSDSF